MRNEFIGILNAVTAAYPNGPYAIRAGGRFYPEWYTGTNPNLRTLQQEMRTILDGAGYRVSAGRATVNGPNVAVIPWATCRIYGDDTTRRTKSQQGVYVNYLFGKDGQEMFLVLGLATFILKGRNFPEWTENNPTMIKRMRMSLENTDSEEISAIKQEIGNKLQTGEFLFSAPDVQNYDWQYACPYYIRYDAANIPVEYELQKDLVDMTRLYTAISKQRMVAPLDEIIENIKQQGNPNGEDIELNGVTYSENKIKSMLMNFSILPYRFNPERIPMEYSLEDWINLEANCDYLRFSNRGDERILLWDYKISKTNDHEDIERIIRCHKIVILEGPPGVGKTYFYNKLVKSNYFDECELITFNPATENSDFIGGLTPIVNTTTNTLTFEGKEGIFVRMLKASADRKVLLWIDEVNRGNVAKIFGEFIGLLGTEEPYDISIRNIGLQDDILRGSDYNLDNFHVVGTLNTADQSISTIDLAIRRRFQFVRMYHDFSVLESPTLAVHRSDPSKVYALPRINDILDKYGSDAVLGHSYLYELEEAYAKGPVLTMSVWEYSILPNLVEILMREQVSNEDLIKINKELRNIGFKIVDRGKGYGQMKIIVPSDVDDDTISHLNTDQLLDKTENVLKWQNNIILEGVPGVGKTWTVRKLWDKLTIPVDNRRTVTFGPATEPEDFVGGLFPKPGIAPPTFEYLEGVLMELAILANDNPDEDFALFIDEINRANLPKVMGSLMTIIETSKRYAPTKTSRAWMGSPPLPPPPVSTEEAEYRVALAHENGKNVYFGLPTNLYIVGAMNTSDRSVIHLDGALRRRFSFIRVDTMLSEDGFDDFLQALQDSDDSGYWMDVNIDECRDLLWKFVELNKELWKIIGPDGVLGHSYFFDAKWCKTPFEIMKQRCQEHAPQKILTQPQLDLWRISSFTN